VVADEARRHRKLDWQAESTIVLQPISSWSGRTTAR
jgi:hypothetical protein